MNTYRQRFKSFKERFEEKIEMIPECGCWIWMGHTHMDGYGLMKFNEAIQRSHRVSWELFKGEIPKGLWVLHHCDTPLCVNPNHLFLGTQNDNMKDCKNKKRHSFGENRPFAKLTGSQVQEIKTRLLEGNKQQHIARDYGVARETIVSIKRGKSWTHI